MKKIFAVILAMTLTATVVLCGCAKNSENKENDNDDWKNKGYDLSLPELDKDGWYLVFEDDFNGTKLNENIKFGERYNGNKEIWTTSPHAIRWQSDKKRNRSRLAGGVPKWSRLKIQMS